LTNDRHDLHLTWDMVQSKQMSAMVK